MPTLHFKGKTAIENHHHTVPHHRLEFDSKLSLLPKGQRPSLDGNLIIEGDNLLALKALLPTHAGKVKCIYIDPPYNTGNEGWVYNDNLTQPQFKEWIGQTVGKEGEDACRHDKWCCMMYPRLTLLREFLTDDGVLFISIDDNELGNLRLIADEVFHTDLPFCTFVWKRRSSTGLRGDAVSVDHEYVLAYARQPERVRLTGLVRSPDDYPYEDVRGRYASTDLTVGMSQEERPNQAYMLVNPRTKKKYPHNPDRVWGYELATMRKHIADDLIIWPEDDPGSRMTRPRFKTYFDPEHPKIRPVSSWIASTSERADVEDDATDVLSIASGLNTEGGRALRRALGKKQFDYPKPPSLISSLIRISTGNSDIVLDSFAGSGTTGEAVQNVNQADGGERRFVLVQMPFDNEEQRKDNFNICRHVTVPRVKAYGGTFTFARVGEPLFGEYRDLGEKLPDWETLARYIFYTETSRECEPKKFNARTGFIGATEPGGGTSYYLLYTPNQRDECEVTISWLDEAAGRDPNRTFVVYTERIWMDEDDRRKWERENNRRVRTMVVPFNLK